MKYFSLPVLLIISLLTVVLSAADVVAAEECGGDFSIESLTQPKRHTLLPTLALYSCKGGLFLVDTQTSDVLLRINESWWLEAVEASSWNEQGTALTVTARFITGIGPEAAVPFSWSFVVNQDARGVWQAHGRKPKAEAYRIEADGMIEIARPEQLQALGLSAGEQPYAIDIDFDQQRLIIMSTWVESVDAPDLGIQVARSRRAYFVTHEGSAKRETSGQQHAVIYLVLPKDTRYVSFEDPELDAKPFKAVQGVIARGTYNGAPSSTAQADLVMCHFTEPYITIVHDTARATVVESTGLSGERNVYTDVGLELVGVNTLKLRWGAWRMDLTVDYQGSDLMSDFVYPISARHGRVDQAEPNRHGGCTSKQLASIEPIE